MDEAPATLPTSSLLPCIPPFTEPPLTHSDDESMSRDLTWRAAFMKCAAKVDDTRRWIEDKQNEK